MKGPNISGIFLMVILCLLWKKVQSSGCSKSFPSTEIQKSRLEQIKGNILAQLGSFEPARVDAALPSIEEQRKQNETMAIYYELVQHEITPEPKCISEEFYAKPVTTFTGMMSPTTEGLPLRTKRGTGYSSPAADPEATFFEGSVLKQYTINMQDMELPKNQSMLSKADLLLHQLQTDTLNQPVGDERQVVQIRAIIKKVRYFVDKKSMSVYSRGPQIFNVLRAMQVWVEEGGNDRIVLEVLITCSSSPNCSNSLPHGRGGKLMPPAAVQFEYNPTDTSRLPRIVTLSKNPRDVDHWSSRRKRSAENESPTFCNENQVTCCLHSFNISFEDDLKLKSILLPKEFSANYCDGHCTNLEGLGSSERINFLEYLRENPSISVEPCCSGLEYKRLTVLMQIYNPKTKTNKHKIDHLDQVSVTKCTCA